MENVVISMIEHKTTDIDFDESKSKKYIVTNYNNGEKSVIFYGQNLEAMSITFYPDYNIKNLSRYDSEFVFMFWIVYDIFFISIGFIITYILFEIYSILVRIVKFFKE